MAYLWVLSLLALPLSQLPNRVILGLLLVWVIARSGSRTLQIPYFKWVTGLALVLVALGAMANQELSKEFMLLLSLPAQALFLIFARPGSANFKRGFHAAILTALMVLIVMKVSSVALQGFDSYFAQEQWWNQWHYENFTQSLSLHPTYLSLFLLTGLVMLLFGSEGPSLRNGMNGRDLALFVAYLFGLWLSSSKIALLTLGLILILFWVHKLIRSSKRQSIAYGVLIALTLLAPCTSPSVRHRMTHGLNTAMQSLPAERPNRFTERRALWKSALIEIDRHPLLGTSFRGISSREAIYPKAKFLYPPLEKPMNAHNNFIEFGLRYGILFGILLILSAIFGIYTAVRRRSLELLGFTVVFFMVSMTESFLFREQGLSLAALIFLFYYLFEDEGNI